MMIKRYADKIKNNPYFDTKIPCTITSITISKETDENCNKDSITTYFDAAFSRTVVDNRKSIGRFVYIEEDYNSIDKGTFFIFDGSNFIKEKSYKNFVNFINGIETRPIQNNNPIIQVNVYVGDCICEYDDIKASIEVYPINQCKKGNPEFKII